MNPIVFKGRRRVLDGAGDVIVLEAGHLASGDRLYSRRHPDVVLADLKIRGPQLGALSLLRRISSHDGRTRILVFSTRDDPGFDFPTRCWRFHLPPSRTRRSRS
jgi:two-component system, NarL family, invasion response regulator UvrY